MFVNEKARPQCPVYMRLCTARMQAPTEAQRARQRAVEHALVKVKRCAEQLAKYPDLNTGRFEWLVNALQRDAREYVQNAARRTTPKPPSEIELMNSVCELLTALSEPKQPPALPDPPPPR